MILWDTGYYRIIRHGVFNMEVNVEWLAVLCHVVAHDNNHEILTVILNNGVPNNGYIPGNLTRTW